MRFFEILEEYNKLLKKKAEYEEALPLTKGSEIVYETMKEKIAQINNDITRFEHEEWITYSEYRSEMAWAKDGYGDPMGR
jgi:HKD family nuclease